MQRCVFTDLSAVRFFGREEATIRWDTTPETREAEFYIYRSETGLAPWKLLNETDPVRGPQLIYADTKMERDSLAANVHYRVLGNMDGVLHHSPVVGFLDELTVSQYRGARAMQKLELQRMRSGNGLRVWQFIPLTEGKPNPWYDAATQQQVGVECPNAADPSFGLPFVGGYGPPSWTYIEIGQRVDKLTDRQDGTGASESVEAPARTLCFPKPSLGHMFVHPATDDRWVVGEDVKPYRFRGTIPIAYDVPLTLLTRGDARYNLQIPASPA